MIEPFVYTFDRLRAKCCSTRCVLKDDIQKTYEKMMVLRRTKVEILFLFAEFKIDGEAAM